MPALRWPTQISADMVAAAVLKPDRMATLDLFQYIRHLQANGQSAQRYEIEFWRKVFPSAQLPGHGGIGPALCLPAFPGWFDHGYVFGGDGFTSAFSCSTTCLVLLAICKTGRPG